MEPTHPLDFDLLTDYLSGTCTAEQRRTVDQWIAAHPDHALAVQRLRAAWMSAQQHASQHPSTDPILRGVMSHVWASRAERMSASEGNADHGRDRSHPRRPLAGFSARARTTVATRMAAVAASVLVVAGVISAIWRHRDTSMPAVAHRYATVAGQQAHVLLPDGTRLHLAPRTRVDVADGFGRRSREITVVGEAFFDVAPQRDVPFVVHAGAVHTQVLGTQFDVRHYASDTVVRVAVVSGKVVSRGGRSAPVTLTAGMIAQVTDSTVTSTTGSDVGTAVSWTQGRLVFTDVPVSQVLAAMERWYGYHFAVADSAVLRDRVKTTLDVGEFTKTLTALEVLLDATAQVHDSTVTLQPRHARRATPHGRNPNEILTSLTEVGK